MGSPGTGEPFYPALSFRGAPVPPGDEGSAAPSPTRAHTVELETALPDRTQEVEVVARIGDRVGGRLSDYVRALPPGTRSRDGIDRQVREERDSWS